STRSAWSAATRRACASSTSSRATSLPPSPRSRTRRTSPTRRLPRPHRPKAARPHRSDSFPSPSPLCGGGLGWGAEASRPCFDRHELHVLVEGDRFVGVVLEGLPVSALHAHQVVRRGVDACILEDLPRG